MSVSIVDKLNALSGEMESLLDFIAKDKNLGDDFEAYVEENKLNIEKQSQLNIALIEYLLDGKMQDNTRVLDYYVNKGEHKNLSVVNAYKNSITSVFEIKKVLKNAYETYSLTCEKDFCLIPLVKMVNLRGISRGDFIRARVIEFENEYYLLEIYDVISSLNCYKAACEAVKCLISNSKCAIFENEEKNQKIKKSLLEFGEHFKKTFNNAKEGIITTNKLTDGLLDAFNSNQDTACFICEPDEYKFFDIKEFSQGDDFIQNAIGGFSNHKCTYDVGLYFDENEGLYVVPFLGTFYKIFETYDGSNSQIEGAKECIKDFLKSDKVPFSVIAAAAKKYQDFLDVINFALDTNFQSTGEVLERFKGHEDEKYSPVQVLYNSKIFSEILGLKEEDEKRETNAASGAIVGRNDPCPCGSGKKYKKCCGAN